MIGIEGLAVVLGGPESSGLFVGKRDGGFVVSDPFGQGERPGRRPIERLLPDPSIERTSPGKPGAASHVKC